MKRKILIVVVITLLITSLGCSAGLNAGSTTPPDEVVPASRPTPLPRRYTLAILPPLPAGSAAQAEAIDDDGLVVGHSVINFEAEATEWANGRAIDLGPGVTLAVNAHVAAADRTGGGYAMARWHDWHAARV